MNASEQATGLDITSKIATIVNVFKQEFPDVKADLNPWHNDPDTINLVDPESIDIGFHFPGWSRKLQSRSILVQIRFHKDLVDKQQRLIGIETAGFNHTGQVWKMSTVDNWEIVGKNEPTSEVKEKLKHFCKTVLNLFHL
jgi:hypothetical protein